MNNFDIRIKDNFLEKKIFNKIHSKISYYPYSGTTNYQSLKENGTEHIWFACDTEIEINNEKSKWIVDNTV